MRKSTLLFFLSALCCAFNAFADETTIFHSDFDTQADFDRWTVVNANNDDYTWTWYESSGHNTASIRWNSTIASDDWLISPQFTAPQDGVYKLTVMARCGGSSKEDMDFAIGDAATVEAMTKTVASYEGLTGEPYHTLAVLVSLKAGEATHLGIHARSAAGQWRILIDEVTIESCSGKDAAVTAITSPTSGVGLTTVPVTVKIANNGINALSSFPVEYSVNGGEKVTETFTQTIAPGETADFTFSQQADISKSRTNYTFKAWTALADDVIATNDTCTVAIYNGGNATVPYFMGFEADENASDFKFFNLNDDDGNWSLNIASGWFNMARTGNGCLMYDYNRNNAGNDWAILDPIEVEPGYYSLKFWFSGMNDHNERLGVYYGNANTVEAMTNKIVEYNPFLTNEYTQSATVFHIDKKQVIYLGFYAFSDKNENVILIDDLSLQKIEATDVDLSLDDLTYPESYIRDKSNRNAAFSITNHGISDISGATLTVTVDDKVITQETVSIAAQATVAKVVTDATANLAAGTHTLKAEITATGDNEADNNTLTRTFTVVGDPVKFWDFENHNTVDGENVYYRPTDLTYLNQDGGTLNASVAGNFPDALGWGPMEIGHHEIYGDCMLGVTSYIDGVSKADRWCIFPQMKVTGDNAHFVWSAQSVDGNYPETYRIMIEDGNHFDPDWFSTVTTINNEPAIMQTHGVDLSSYKDKDIYVAIRLTSSNAFILTVDNVGFYGDITTSASSISTTDSDNRPATLTLQGTTLQGSDDVTAITVCDMSGRTVLATTGSTADTGALAPGIYIATGSTASGNIVCKFAVK